MDNTFTSSQTMIRQNTTRNSSPSRQSRRVRQMLTLQEGTHLSSNRASALIIRDSTRYPKTRYDSQMHSRYTHIVTILVDNTGIVPIPKIKQFIY